MENVDVCRAANELFTEYSGKWYSLKQEDQRYRWLIKAVKSCDELNKQGKKRILAELRERRRTVVAEFHSVGEVLEVIQPYCITNIGAEWSKKLHEMQQASAELDHVWDKFTPTPLVLQIPDGYVDNIVNGVHVWQSYEQFRSYELGRLTASPMDYEAELKAYREEKRVEKEKLINSKKEQVREFFLSIFKELPKSERRKFDNAEELQLIVDEAKHRYLTAKEDPEDWVYYYYRSNIKGDETGKEVRDNFVMRAITTNKKVENRKNEAFEMWALKCKVREIGHEMCKNCYRKGQSHNFCVKCHRMMAEELKKLKDAKVFEMNKDKVDDSTTAVRKMEYVKKKILGAYRHPELDGKLMRWFLYGYGQRKKEDILNYLCTTTLLVEQHFIDFDLNDALEIVKKKIASAKYFWRSGGYAGWTDRFDILEQMMLELLEYIKKEMTKDWVYLPADAVDEDCGLKGLVKEVLPNGTVRYKMRAWVNKIDYYDSAKLVCDMEHLDDGEEVDAIEQIADKASYHIFGANIDMERLAHLYRIFNHPYYELLTSLQGIGRYESDWVRILLQRFFELALKDFGYDVEVFRKKCDVKRLDYKSMLDFYSTIAVWAKAHKMGEL